MSSPVIAMPIGYYLGMVTSEYRQAKQQAAWLEAVLSIANDISTCLASMSDAFDLDYAVGVQLDILGLVIGVSRVVSFQPTGGGSPVLDDETYRLLLKATRANNFWKGTIGELYPIWNALFPGGHIIIIDNQDMSATILMTGTFSSIIQDLIRNGYIVPRPQGVKYTYSFGTPPFFGFDREDAFISGLGTGKWS